MRPTAVDSRYSCLTRVVDSRYSCLTRACTASSYVPPNQLVSATVFLRAASKAAFPKHQCFTSDCLSMMFVIAQQMLQKRTEEYQERAAMLEQNLKREMDALERERHELTQSHQVGLLNRVGLNPKP